MAVFCETQKWQYSAKVRIGRILQNLRMAVICGFRKWQNSAKAKNHKKMLTCLQKYSTIRSDSQDTNVVSQKQSGPHSGPHWFQQMHISARGVVSSPFYPTLALSVALKGLPNCGPLSGPHDSQTLWT